MSLRGSNPAFCSAHATCFQRLRTTSFPVVLLCVLLRLPVSVLGLLACFELNMMNNKMQIPKAVVTVVVATAGDLC